MVNASTSSSPVALIPREVLFGNPERLSPQLSPDGRHLAYIAPDEHHVLQVWVRLPGQEKDQILTKDPKRGIRSFFWTYLPDTLIYLQDSNGDENFHLYAVHIERRDVRDLTPFDGVRAQVVAVEPQRPTEILVALNKTDKRKHDVYRLNLESATLTLEAENPGHIIGWTPDADLHVRAALAATPDGGHELWWRPETSAAWKTIRTWGPDDEGYPVDFSADGKILFVVGNHDANAKQLLAVDPVAGTEVILAKDAKYDVSGILSHPTTRVIQAVSFYREKLTWDVLDPSLAEDFETLQKGHPGEMHISRGDLSDRVWLISYVVDDGPVRYYRYDRPSRTSTFLFSQRPKAEGLPLVPIKPIAFDARDGLHLEGYVTLPGGVAPKALPTVVLVHGGPWARDHWGFNPMAQWLANRGYAVLQINYRGSTGYGKQFLNAGNREWAGKMHTDLLDGVDWLVGRGIADPKRVAIMGGSYGGYATLVGLTFTPDVFACGVDIVGPSNIITLIQTIPAYWEPMKATFARRLGVVDRDEDFMRSRSPLFFVDKIKVPLLIGQGANDPRVKQAESDQIVEAMRKNGKPVEYWIYADEGHGFARPQNRMHFYTRAEAFLARVLGGRVEPEHDLPGHSAREG